MSKKTKKRHPKPKPIRFGTARQHYATAYANRPPTKKLDTWSWKMCIHDASTEQQSISLGRLHIKDVTKTMEEVYKS